MLVDVQLKSGNAQPWGFKRINQNIDTVSIKNIKHKLTNKPASILPEPLPLRQLAFPMLALTPSVLVG